MSVLAVVPARGGSKGIPRKNLCELAGRPLLVHTIEQAQASRRIDRVVVSTDDEEIGAVAERAGADVLWRPAALAADSAPTLPVLTHAVDHSGNGGPPRIVVTLQPTSPLRRAAQIDEAIGRLDSDCDSVVSVCLVEHSPYKMYRIEEAWLAPFVDGTRPGIPRQSLPPVYRENGAIYATWTSVLIEQQSIWGKQARPYLMDLESSIDIDSLYDLEIARWILAGGDGR